MDRVQVYKQETGALGGNPADTTDYPAPIKPQEDAIEAAGLFVQDAVNRDQNVLISRSGNNLQFKDPNNPVDVPLSALVAARYPYNFHQAASEAEDTTTNPAYTTKVTLTTASLPAGTYYIGWSAEVASSATNRDAKAQVLLDGATTIAERFHTTNLGAYTSFSGFYIVALTAAIHTVDIQHARIANGGTSYIRRARLTLWRVA